MSWRFGVDLQRLPWKSFAAIFAASTWAAVQQLWLPVLLLGSDATRAAEAFGLHRLSYSFLQSAVTGCVALSFLPGATPFFCLFMVFTELSFLRVSDFRAGEHLVWLTNVVPLLLYALALELAVRWQVKERGALWPLPPPSSGQP